MTHPATIDRDEELALFDSMLAGKTEERILLIQAESGWGKSELLRAFAHRCPTGIRFAEIDFKGGGTSLAELFSRLCDKLGGWDRFPKLKTELQSIVHPSINVASNLIVGQNQIEMYLGGRDEQERQARLSTLTDSFFADLRTLGKSLLIFDTFEKSDDVIQKWLADSFLSRAQNSPNLFIVVGGRRVPVETLEWEYLHIPLSGISYEHWHRYAENIGVIDTLDFIRGCCSLCRGHPLKMKTHIDGLARQRQMA